MRRLLAPCVFCVLALLTEATAKPQEELRVGIFSESEPGEIPSGWETLRFPSVREETVYSLFREGERVVLKADSRTSASALLKKVTLDTGRYPYLTWSWKAAADCFSGSWRHPDTDDFPLRLFVLFESGGFFSFFRTLGSTFSGDAILYLAGAPSPAETERSTHLSGRIKVLPLSRTQGSIPEWDQITRNVRDDYVTLFGKEPRNVKAVAFMTDTDNSQTECVSYFGDISFSESVP